MGARYPYYLLADSPEGQRKESEVARTPPKTMPTRGDIRHGFVYRRHAYITSGAIANNAEIDVIWEKWQETLEPLRAALNKAFSKKWEEWEIPRESGEPWDQTAQKAHAIALDARRSATERDEALAVINFNTKSHYTRETLPEKPRYPWPPAAEDAHARWWEARISRQREIDASIAAKADFEYLYDKPYVDKDRIRVAGPFTVESLSPHRTLAVDWDDELIDAIEAAEGNRAAPDRDDAITDFAQMILENLKVAGVQQAHKEDRISFTRLVGWPGNFICAEGRFMEGEKEKRAGVFIGPEFGTVARPDLVAAAREAGDAGFDVLIACAFNYDALTAKAGGLGIASTSICNFGTAITSGQTSKRWSKNFGKRIAGSVRPYGFPHRRHIHQQPRPTDGAGAEGGEDHRLRSADGHLRPGPLLPQARSRAG